LTRAHALGALPRACGTPVGLLASLTRIAAFEARNDVYISLREENWSLHEDLHLDFELRTLAS
jgi:hypothetical protein